MSKLLINTNTGATVRRGDAKAEQLLAMEGSPFVLADEADPPTKPDATVTLDEANSMGDDHPGADAGVKDVKAWVGEDAHRAHAALEIEEARDKPRASLVGFLEGLMAD